jgi:hypothetical protein
MHEQSTSDGTSYARFACEQWLERLQAQGQPASTAHTLLSATLFVAVRSEIAHLQSMGGPVRSDYEQLRRFSNMLEDDPDRILSLQFGGKAVGLKKGETAKVFAQLARVIAVLAFYPGGITIFGSHFEAQRIEAEDV